MRKLVDKRRAPGSAKGRNKTIRSDERRLRRTVNFKTSSWYERAAASIGIAAAKAGDTGLQRSE